MDRANSSDPPPKKKTPRGRYLNYFEPTTNFDVVPRTTLLSHSSARGGSCRGYVPPPVVPPDRRQPVAINQGDGDFDGQPLGNVTNRVQPSAASGAVAVLQVQDEPATLTVSPDSEVSGSSPSFVDESRSDSDSTSDLDSVQQSPARVSNERSCEEREGNERRRTPSPESEQTDDDNDLQNPPVYDRSLTAVQTQYDEGVQNIPCVGLCTCSRCDLNNVETDDSPQPVRRQEEGEGSDVAGGAETGGGGDDVGCGEGRQGVGGDRGDSARDRWNQKYRWNDPVLPNLSTTKFEAMLMILHIVMRHGMSGPFIEDMLKFVNVLLGDEVLPTSQFIFKKLFAPHVSLNFHFYCVKCELYLGEKSTFEEGVVTCVCGQENKVHNLASESFFVTFSVKEQLEEMFKRPNFKISPRVDGIGALTDILDGDIYKRLFAGGATAANEHTLTITFNTDGAPVWSGPKGSIWPIIYIVNELDPEIRFKPENVLMCGLYYGKKSPNMSTFFTPFVKEMQELALGGVQKICEDGTEVSFSVFATTCSVDLMAKCKVQCTKQCNGRLGCGYCMHPNNTVCEGLPPNQGRYSTLSPDYPYPLRTHDEMVADMLQADSLDRADLLKGDSVNGIKGISPLLGLPKVDIVNIFAIDYMHHLKGVSEKICEVLFESKQYVDTISNEVVADRLCNMKPPHTMTRFPRSLSSRSEWKAKEWIGFLLYCLIPCVHDMLPERNFNNLCDLVEGLHILLRDSISYGDLERADASLQRFLREFNVLYGDRHMTHNMHLLSHLALTVKNCGPLPGVSAFPFESFNGFLLKLVAGTSGVVTQICQKYATVSFVSHYFEEHIMSGRVLNYCNNVFSYDYLKKSEKYSDGRSLGRATEGHLTLQEQLAMNEADVVLQDDSYLSYNRVVKERNVYYARIYTKPKVYDDTCVKLDDNSYAVIEKLVVVPGYENVWALVKPIRISQSPNDQWVHHIKSCAAFMYDPLKCVKFGDISSKCILIENLAHSGRSFVCEVPNRFERD